MKESLPLFLPVIFKDDVADGIKYADDGVISIVNFDVFDNVETTVFPTTARVFVDLISVWRVCKLNVGVKTISVLIIFVLVIVDVDVLEFGRVVVSEVFPMSFILVVFTVDCPATE